MVTDINGTTSTSNTSDWTLTSGGSLTQLSGVGHLDVTATTIERTPFVSTNPAATFECSTSNLLGTACGSVQVNGTFTSITFSWTGDGIEGGGADGVELALDLPGNDYGDAPISFGAPLHSVPSTPLLFLGTAPDDDPGTQSNAAATGDGGDEDGVSFPTYTTDDPIYTVPVTLTNSTGALATVCGWIDFNLDGNFDTNEDVCNTVAAGATSTNLVFDVSGFDLLGTANYYSRVRICSTASECNLPVSNATNGEVEDYLLPIDTLPVTLSSFSSTRSGSYVDVDWGTSSELFNVGFQLWGLDGADGEWERLHNRLIKSGSGNAVEPQSYSKRAKVPNSIDQLVSVGDIEC